MKSIFGKTKWWRSPPVLILSVVAAAALLFISGRVALKAFAADTAPNGTYIIRYLIGDGVTFDTGEAEEDDTPITTTVIDDDNRIIRIYNANPSRTHYTFDGWKVRNNSSGSDVKKNKNATVDLTYFAAEGGDVYATTAVPNWKKNITVKYNKNTDDDVTGLPSLINSLVPEDGSYSLNMNVKRTGYTLMGWTIGADGGETIKSAPASAFTKVNDDGRFELTFYAVWQKNYNVTYDFQNGTDSETVMGVGLKIGYKSNSVSVMKSWSGYTFVEWNTRPDGSGDSYAQGQENVLFSDDITLYAQWNKNYKLTYKGNGGNFGKTSAGTVISEKSETFELPFQQTGTHALGMNPEPTKVGQLFDGWSETNDNRDAVASIDLSHFVQSGSLFVATVYAVWADDTFIASYNANIPIGVTNHNMIDGDVNVTYSELASGYKIQPVEPAADGCKFVQWDYVYYNNSVDSDGNPKPQTPWISQGGTISAGCFTNNPTKKVTISASWNKLYRMHRDYQADGDTVTGPSADSNWSKNAPTPDITYSVYKGEPTREGYKFICWSKDPDKAEEVTELKEADFNTLVDGRWQATVYAIWAKKVNLTYNGNFPLYEGDEMPTKVVVGNPNEFNIQTGSYVFGGNAYLPYQKGHDFINWNTRADGKGTSYEPLDENGNTNKVTFADDITLYAQWARKFQLHYDQNSPYSGNITANTITNLPGNDNFTVPVNDMTDESFRAPSSALPTTNGFTCIGWSTAADDRTLIDKVPLNSFEAGGTYTKTLYAVWEPKTFHIVYETGLPETVQVNNMPAQDDFLYTDMDNNSTGGGWRYWAEQEPSANGYTFDGWEHFYYDADGIKHDTGTVNFTGIWLDSFLKSRDATVILRAKWKSKFTLKYYKNVKDGQVILDEEDQPVDDTDRLISEKKLEGTDFDENGQYDKLLGYNYKITSPDENKHTYTAMGWSTTRNNDLSTKITYLTTDQFIYNEETDRFELSVYLIWARNVELIYAKNQDETSSEFIETYVYGNPEISDAKIRSSGNISVYTEFINWNTAYDGSGVTYEPGDIISLTEDLTLYAQLNKRFYLTFNKNWPENIPGTVTNMPDPVKFVAHLNTITDKSTHELPDDVPELTSTNGQKRYFIGWSLTPDGDVLENDEVPLNEFTKLSGYNWDGEFRYGKTLFAVWSTEPFAVEYKENHPEPSLVTNMPEDEPELSYSSVRKGYRIPDNRPEAPGCTFATWQIVYTDRNGNEKYNSIAPGRSVSPLYFRSSTQKVTANAQWTKKYAVVYDCGDNDDGTVTSRPADKTFNVFWNSTQTDYSVTKANARRNGYTLVGWSNETGSDETMTLPVTTPLTDFTLNAGTDRFEKRLYAVWQRNYRLNYNENAASGSVSEMPQVSEFKRLLNVSSEPLSEKIPVRSGYAFKGWALSPDSTTVLAHNAIPLSTETFSYSDRGYFETTVYAVWEANEHTVSYELEYADGVAAEDVGVTAPAAQTHAYREENIAVSAAPSGYDAAAYQFDGWKTTDVTVTDGKFTMPDKNVVFKGKFTRNVRTVTYRAGEGEGSDITESFTSGSTTSVKSANTFLPPAGKEFDRWVCDTQGYSTTPGDDITVNDNVVYTALWKNVFYTLQYDKGEVPAITGTLPASRSDITWADLRAGEVFISETEIQSDGYTFTGWKITNGDDDSIFKIYDASKFGSLSSTEQLVNEALFDGTRNAAAVAQWKHNYTVTYNVSGIPSDFDYPATQSDSYAEGTKVSLKAKPIGYDDDHYEFIGWDSEDIDTDQSSFTVDRHIVITGKFRAKAVPPQPVTYTVTYQSGGDSPEEYTDTDISGDYTLLDISDVGFTVPEGMSFDRWVLVTPDDKEYPENANAGAGINVISDVTYQAVWSSSSPAFPTATITYTSGLTEDYPGYNESCSTSFVINDVPTTAEYSVLGNDPNHSENPSFAPDGYEFAGWKPISRTSGASPRSTPISGGAGADGLYHEGDTIAADDLKSGSVTLQAMWKVTLTYDANGGTGSLPENGEPIPVLVDGTATAASGGSLTRSGARFDHWNTKPNDNGTKYQPGQNLVMKNNTVLYAIYTDSPDDDTGSGEPDGTTFTVIYKPNGGTGNVPKDDKQYSAGATVAVASKGHLVRTGCTFKEWNTKPDGSGTGYKGDGSDSFVISADTTLYAVWVDGSGKIIPSPGTGESSLPMIIAVNAALLSLAALVFMVARERRKSAENC